MRAATGCWSGSYIDGEEIIPASSAASAGDSTRDSRTSGSWFSSGVVVVGATVTPGVSFVASARSSGSSPSPK